MSEWGNLYVIAAPSGTGKTTLVKSVVDALYNITVSISHTTRLKRPSETEGIHYYFIDESEFRHMIQKNEFLEHATVFNHLYGTSRIWVEDTLKKGLDVILEIDWQGCQQIQTLFPNCISIFILPPSLAVLANRLTLRNQDKPEIIQKRLADAEETIKHIPEYHYLIINDDFDTAITELKTVILSSRLKTSRQIHKFSELIKEFTKT